MPEINNDIKTLRTPPSELLFKRVKGSGSPMEQVIPEIADVISEWQSVEELCQLVDPRKELLLTQESLSFHINWLNEKASESISKGFVLFDGQWKSEVFLEISLGYYSNLEKLKISISSKSLNQDSVIEQLLNSTEQVGRAFDAFTGYLYGHDIAVFNEQHNLPLRQFDSSRIPYGIWWVNYWSQQQVETVGREKIANAGWSRVITLSNNAVIAFVADTKPDLTRSEHIQAFERITRNINLRELQLSSHPPQNFSFDSPG
jgi:hypothetical protein